MELALERPELRKLVTAVEHGAIRLSDVYEAREAMFLGTTLDCIACTTYDGRTIGTGKRGEVAAAFQKALMNDIENGPLSIQI
jgi:branched-subunit amino acid aminotransferase/4-amino-4-deoxychorismate lyase